MNEVERLIAELRTQVEVVRNVAVSRSDHTQLRERVHALELSHARLFGYMLAASSLASGGAAAAVKLLSL